MEKEHKRRLLLRLNALRAAVEECEIPEEVLAVVYEKMWELDALFPEGVKTHSFGEIEGYGKEVWRSIDVDKYLAEERASWD